MWVFDLDTHRFLAVNGAAVVECGYPPEKFLTLTIRDVYGESDLARFDHGLASDAQELDAGLWSHRRGDGTSLQVEIRSNDLTFQNHRARLIHATSVTARLQAEAARRESEQLIGAIVESSDDSILSTTADGAPYETTRLDKDGRRLLVWVAISPIVNSSGVVVGMSSIARDITQRKAMEDQLRQAQKMEAMGEPGGRHRP
jgi:PAS domain-containing protein